MKINGIGIVLVWIIILGGSLHSSASLVFKFQEGIIAPKDSGNLKNGIKEGFWVEYEIDKGKVTPELQKMVAQQGLDINKFITLRKEEGNYVKGKKSDLWTAFKTEGSMVPHKWQKERETTYRNDIKDGKELIYNNLGGVSDKLLIERNWKNGIESGIGKIYKINPPYKLEKVYKAVNEKLLLLETYHSNGTLETKFIDTVINKKPLKYFNNFYDDGTLKQSGFYEKDTVQFGKWESYYEHGSIESMEFYKEGKIDGVYKYYHKNGQLWTKTIYKNGLLWEVIDNFNNKGQKKDKGTLSKGTGKVNIYDEKGDLSRSVEYKSGVQIK